MEKKMIKHYKELDYWDFDVSLLDLAEMVAEFIKKYGPDAEFCISGDADVEIEWVAEETDAEYKLRRKSERLNAERQRAREVKMMNMLIDKYGVPDE